VTIVAEDIALLPDAGPLITLAYADALNVLFEPGWRVMIVDTVLFEVTRNHTPTSEIITQWVSGNEVYIVPTKTLAAHLVAPQSRTAHLGEQAIQETLNTFALANPPQHAVLLFEDHAIAKQGFFVPPECQKVSTRAYLMFLEQKGWIENAAAIERQAIQAGRQFSRLRFPPEA
jgi:hypothetical protein